MRIKISDKTATALTAALEAVQSGCRARLVSAADLLEIAKVAEKALADLDLPKAERAGARYLFTEGALRGVANTYRGNRTSTQVIIERGSSDWYLIEASRPEFWPNDKNRSGVQLTASQRESAVARFAASLPVYQTAA